MHGGSRATTYYTSFYLGLRNVSALHLNSTIFWKEKCSTIRRLPYPRKKQYNPHESPCYDETFGFLVTVGRNGGGGGRQAEAGQA
jgi:hypothetical protein